MSALHLGNRVRLRIAAVELQPVISKRVIKGEIRIDGKVVDELAPVEIGQPLSWTKPIICDVPPGSRLHLVVHERHLRIHSQYESESCLVSEIIQESVKKLMININNMDYTAELKVFDQADVNNLFTKGHNKLVEMEQEDISSGKLRATQRIFKTMLQFGSAVAEAHPAAKIVFAVCTCAWTRLEEQQKSDEQLDELAGRLVGMVPLVEEVKKYAQLELLRHNIEEFLHLIEDVSIFAMGRETKRPVVRLIQSFVDSSDKDRIDQLEKRFRKISNDFSTAISIQTMAAVMTSREQELLEKLDPVKPSGHDPSQACQEGTRLSVLNDIDSWIHATGSEPPLMWIHGQAGIGKSTISASVCDRLKERRTPAVSFFCKRDDPARRNPLRLISSIAYGLACRYPPYGKLVAASISTDPELRISHLGVRYEGLLKHPLSELRNAQPPFSQIVLVDALDECGTTETRKQVLGHLRDLSSLVPGLRVIVTSRPDSDIRGFFDQCHTTAVLHIHLHNYSAKGDIRAFIEARLSRVDVDEEWPVDSVDKLCTKAGELFIWAATACKLIASALDPHYQLEQLITESLSGCGLSDLDSLYVAVIRNNIMNQGTASTAYMRQCIGVIVVTSMRQPVSVEVLCELLRDRVKPIVMKSLIKRLGAVIYVDETIGDAVRVYHPSFADFALDERRSGEFWVDPVQRNVELSVGCLSVMERELTFNICELETSHLLSTEVPDLGSKVESNISKQLAYGCAYWISHLFDGEDKEVAAVQMGNIVNGPHLLYWLEVLSLLQKVDVAVNRLRELSTWLSDTYLRRIVWDAYRFVLAFFDPIAASVPHIYVSALALAPRQSEIHRRLSPLFPNTAWVTKGETERWPAWLRSVSHPDYIFSMCISRDSQLLVTACNDGGVRMYNLRTGMLTRTFCVDPPICWRGMKVAISPDGALIVCGTEKKVEIWDANTGDAVENIPLEGGATQYRALLFSEDGVILRIIYSSEPHESCDDITWDTSSRRVLERASIPRSSLDESDGVAFSPEMDRLAVGNSDGIKLQPAFGESVSVVIKAQSKPRLDPRPPPIAFSPDGSIIAANSHKPGNGHTIELWDSRTGAAVGIELIGHTDVITSIAFSRDGKRIVTGSEDQTVRIWDTKTGLPIGDPLLGHSGWVRSVEFSLDETYLVSSAGDKTILIWDAASVSDRVFNDPLAMQVNSEIPKHKLSHSPFVSGPSERVHSVGLSPDGTRIITGSTNKWGTRYGTQATIWDTLTGATINEPHYDCSDRFIFDLAYSSNGNCIMGKGRERAYIWDTRTGSRKDFEISPPSHIYTFSPDGAYLAIAAASDDYDPGYPYTSHPGGIVMFDTGTGDTVGKFEASLSDVKLITFSLDSSRLYSCHLHKDEDKGTMERICIWDTHTYDEVKSASWSLGGYPHGGLHALSPDGGSLASGDPKRFAVFDANTGNVIVGPFEGYSFFTNFSVAFSPDGALLASSSGDYTGVRLWDLKSGSTTPTATIGRGHLHESLAFCPDGTRLVSCSGDQTIHVWDLVPSIIEPWDSESTSRWPTSTYHFPPHPAHPDWVSHDKKAHTLWVPSHYRRTYDKHFLNCISADPADLPVHIDFSKFVHGTDWTSVRDEQALQKYHASK